jgi:hypothetical protein
MDKIKRSIGIRLDLSMDNYPHPEQAEEKIDVRINVKDVTKDFTLQEFKDILGFNQ